MKPQDLIHKALQAKASAQLLLDAGDYDGACDRAYYAMFNAARAALLSTQANTSPDLTRTHNGLITAFSLQLVKTGRVPVELGKALNKAEELRLIADYKNESIDANNAKWAVQQADVFIDFMIDHFI